jgi:UDP-N-acetylmuramate dehydrogenase
MDNIKEKLSSVKENVQLVPYTTFKIGGEARFFLEIEDKKELIRAIKVSQESDIPFFVLGNGSNILFSDKGFNGLVIKINLKKIEIKDNKIVCESGVSLNKLVKELSENGLAGFEWATGIPGSVGGAIRGNAGAFGRSITDNIVEVEVLKKNKIRNYSKEELVLGYRDSIFKKNKDLVIISGSFVFEKDKVENIKEKMNKYLEYRKENHPISFSSAGSVFKNPEGKSAGELIEKCGLKGKKIGGAKISEKHANFIINIDGASSKDVLDLIFLVKKEVKNKFGIELEEEIELVGF